MTAKRELPVVDPVAGGYHFYAFPLAIMGTVERSRDWILSNYIHLAFDRNLESPTVPFCFYLYDYAISPWLRVIRNDRSWLAVQDTDPVRFCRDAVHAGYYVYLNLDDYHVPSRPSHGVAHGSHDLLICGVDDEARTFSTFGYTKEDVMRRSVLGFGQLDDAYRSLDVIPNDCPQVYLYRLNEDAAYDFNARLVRQSFEEYLDAANVSTHFDMFQAAWDRAYGIACYPPLQDYLTRYIEGDDEYDIRYLHILWEHKRLMRLRVERMAELFGPAFAPLAEDSRAIEKQAFALRNKMFFREAAGRASEFGAEEVKGLGRMRAAEERLLERAVEQLKAL